MTRIFVLALALVGFATFANAQTKALQTAKISTPEILCEECKKRVFTYLDRHDGIQSININTKRGETTVKYLTDRTDIEQIKTAIANSGFSADDVPADEGAYKRLPKTCKKAEDGGGHPAPKKPAPAPES